jgi:thioredoxin reductase (NADPH)
MNLSFGNLTARPQEPEQEHHPYKVVVLGSGPAGWSAALYAARAETNPLVLTGLELGGQAALTHVIENYPGFPEGVGGAELGDLFQKQAERFGARVEFDRAHSVDLSSRPFTIETDAGNILKAETLIIATGASPNHLNVPGETKLTGKGVSYCGTCDGWFFKDRRIVVIGGGDSALEEGIFLTRYASKVTIVHRRDTLRAGAILQSRAKANPKIDFIWDSVISEVIGDGAVTGVRLKNLKTNEESVYPCDGVFIFIGHTPNTQMFAGQLDMLAGGYIASDNHMRTSIPGVFAAGEVTDSVFKQVVTSAGMGAAAAIQAVKFLEEHED